MRKSIPFALAIFVWGCLLGHLEGGCMPTPKQQGAIVDGACTIVEAFSGSPEAEAICATAEELTNVLVPTVRNVRADAGHGMRLAPCKIVPTTTTCASDAELKAGVRAVLASRAK